MNASAASDEAEIMSEKPLADETGEPAAENAEGDERGRAIHSGR